MGVNGSAPFSILQTNGRFFKAVIRGIAPCTYDLPTADIVMSSLLPQFLDTRSRRSAACAAYSM